MEKAESQLQYDHGSSIALFKGVYVAVWNGNDSPSEGVAQQYIFISTSTDRVSYVVAAGQGVLGCGRVHKSCRVQCILEWQPNLVVLDGDKHLGYVWSICWLDPSVSTHNRCTKAGRVCWSTLDKPSGLWDNRLVTFGGAKNPTSDRRRNNRLDWCPVACWCQ